MKVNASKMTKSFRLFPQLLLSAITLSFSFGACNSESTEETETIRIGAVLPFSGELAAVGLNIEQSLSLAVSDVNAAGGVDGKKLELLVRDSNSGSDKGYREAKALLYDEKVKYLIGPEENDLAKSLIQDVKALDILNILPAYTAPSLLVTGNKGAWIRLAPSPQNVGCAMGIKAAAEGYRTAVTLASSDDYQMLLATSFNTYFTERGGTAKGALIVKPGQESYMDQLEIINDKHTELVVMMVYPPTGTVLTEEWMISEYEANWFLAPTLHTDMFLENLPFGALEGFSIFSPSLSQIEECTGLPDSERDSDTTPEGESDAGAADGGIPEEIDTASTNVDCRRENFDRFSGHYTERWTQDRPLPGSLFYYDAVVLLALGLQHAAAEGAPEPSPTALREHIRTVAEGPGRHIRWNELKEGLSALEDGDDIAYSGAASDYQFSTRGGINYGETNHRIIDAWKVQDGEFVLSDSIYANCNYHNLND